MRFRCVTRLELFSHPELKVAYADFLYEVFLDGDAPLAQSDVMRAAAYLARFLRELVPAPGAASTGSVDMGEWGGPIYESLLPTLTALLGLRNVAAAVGNDVAVAADLAHAINSLSVVAAGISPTARVRSAAAVAILSAVLPSSVAHGVRLNRALRGVATTPKPQDRTAEARRASLYVAPAAELDASPVGAATRGVAELVVRLKADSRLAHIMESAFEMGAALYMSDAGARHGITFDTAVSTLIGLLRAGVGVGNESGDVAPHLLAAALKIMRKLVEMQNTALTTPASE